MSASSGEEGTRRPITWLALTLAPLPGIGHWAVRHGGRGLLAFCMLATGVNLVLLSNLIEPVGRLSPALGWTLAGAAVIFSAADVTRIVVRSRRARSAP